MPRPVPFVRMMLKADIKAVDAAPPLPRPNLRHLVPMLSLLFSIGIARLQRVCSRVNGAHQCNNNFKGVATLYGANVADYKKAITIATIVSVRSRLRHFLHFRIDSGGLRLRRCASPMATSSTAAIL